MTFALYAIVEGHGEVSALPILLRRLTQECLARHDVHVLRPHRIPRGRILTGDHLERAAELGKRRVGEFGGTGGIMLLLDADDDCPARLAPELLARLRVVVPEFTTSVVLAKREYEAWFLAAARSLRGRPDVAATAEPPPRPEEIRGAKEYLMREVLVPGRVYSETVDQVSLTAAMSLAEASSCPSFVKLRRDLQSILGMGP